MNYNDFIGSKKQSIIEAGFDSAELEKPDKMKPFQKDIVDWAVLRGRAAIFADTGLGKTIMQLTWSDIISREKAGNILILTPLCVAQQTVQEGQKFGISAKYSRDGSIKAQITITNYEMLKNFNPSDFIGIVVDESSILKGLNGKLRKSITEFAQQLPYRLSCTATPSPNDFMELGTQSEFLGVMSQVEMLATFFTHDGSDTSKWRLKGHGRQRFWEWLATWSIVIRSPSDLGYASEGYNLPELRLHQHIVETEPTEDLFATVAVGLLDRGRARKDSMSDRCAKAAAIMSEWDCGIAWCNLNAEADMMAQLTGAVNIQGSDNLDVKEKHIMAFTDSEIPKIVTKPKIAGFGLNWQHCNNMVFVGLSDSFESFYQAVRRCWRFGQALPVDAHIVISDREGAVLDNIQRKQKQHDRMADEMQKSMRELTVSQIKGFSVNDATYTPKEQIILPGVN